MSAPRYAFRKKRLTALAASVDAVGRRFFRPSAFPEQPKKILIVRLDHLGDVLQATGIPQALKEHFPASEVIFLTSSSGAELLAENPYIDQIIRYDAPWFRRGQERRERTGYWQLVRELKWRSFDLGLSLRGDARENLLLRLAGVRYKVGFGITGGGFLLDRELSFRWDAHESVHSLDLLRSLGIRRDYLLPSVFFSQDEDGRSDRFASEALPRILVGVQLDAGSEAKRWPEENRAAFVDAALRDFPNARFVFFGSDRKIGSWLEKKLRDADPACAVNRMGKTGVRELAVQVKACKLFIGPDSGPAHLAAALGIPTLILYSGTNAFERWRSNADNADYARNSVPCSPCHLTRCNVPGHPCMAGIGVERVLRWLRERVHAG